MSSMCVVPNEYLYSVLIFICDCKKSAFVSLTKTSFMYLLVHLSLESPACHRKRHCIWGFQWSSPLIGQGESLVEGCRGDELVAHISLLMTSRLSQRYGRWSSRPAIHGHICNDMYWWRLLLEIYDILMISRLVVLLYSDTYSRHWIWLDLTQTTTSHKLALLTAIK